MCFTVVRVHGFDITESYCEAFEKQPDNSIAFDSLYPLGPTKKASYVVQQNWTVVDWKLNTFLNRKNLFTSH